MTYRHDKRTQEEGTLLHDISILIDFIFEKTPIWLLGLDKHFVKNLNVVGFNSMTEIVVHLGKRKLDVAFYNQAFISLGIGKITTGLSVRENTDITLVLGSLHSLNEQALGLRKRKSLFVTEHHCNPRRIPKSDLSFS